MVIFAQCYFHPFKPLNYFALSKICPKSLCFYSNKYKKVKNAQIKIFPLTMGRKGGKIKRVDDFPVNSILSLLSVH